MPDFKVYVKPRATDRENDALYDTAYEYGVIIHDGWNGELLVEADSEKDLVKWIKETGDEWAYDDDYFPA